MNNSDTPKQVCEFCHKNVTALTSLMMCHDCAKNAPSELAQLRQENERFQKQIDIDCGNCLIGMRTRAETAEAKAKELEEKYFDYRGKADVRQSQLDKVWLALENAGISEEQNGVRPALPHVRVNALNDRCNDLVHQLADSRKESEELQRLNDECDHQIRELKSPEYWMQLDSTRQQLERAREYLRSILERMERLPSGDYSMIVTVSKETVAKWRAAGENNASR